jgi:hypothetical protein
MWPFKKKTIVEPVGTPKPTKADILTFDIVYTDNTKESVEGTSSSIDYGYLSIQNITEKSDGGQIFFCQAGYVKSMKTIFKETVDLPTA